MFFNLFYDLTINDDFFDRNMKILQKVPEFLRTFIQNKLNMAGIYLHIPFCKQRCIYCDFFSTLQSERIPRYVQALCQEIERRKDYLENEPVETIYLGGGTPSLLKEDDFQQLFDTIFRNFPLAEYPEITMEANPDDLTPEYNALLRKFPFNRISMGIQTFNDAILKRLNRRHTAQQAMEAFANCRKAGFQNISIDLMYGLPGETAESWNRDLQQAMEMRPEHLSAYHLIYEEGTPLWRMREQHRVEEADEDTSLTFFQMLIQRMKEQGYQHYEISNFCLPGLHSRHNSSYWTDKKYLGCGAAAHSYNGTSRQWNLASLDGYIQGITAGKEVAETEELDLYTRYNDFVITTLRTCWGMSLSHLKKEFGSVLADYCLRMASPYIKQNKLTCKQDILKLTEEGIFISDGIMSDLLWVE